MKKLAYLLYVVTILLISGLARANAMTIYDASNSTEVQYQTLVKITSVSVSPSKLQLWIEGSVPNPCFGSPTAMLIQDPTNPTVLLFHMGSSAGLGVGTGACPASIKYFQTQVDLPTLASVSSLNLSDKAIYQIKMEGYLFTMNVSGSDLK